jgi:hypothetical protein
MIKDVGRAASQVSVSFTKVADEQVLEQFFGGGVKVCGVADFSLYIRRGMVNSGIAVWGNERDLQR